MRTEAKSRRGFLQWAAALGAGMSAALAAGARAEAPAASSNLAAFGFTKLLVVDLERSAAFYKAVCGLAESSRIDAEIGGRKLTEIIFQPAAPGAATFVLLTFVGAEKPAADEVILGFRTPDLDAFLARTREAGGSVYQEPHTLAEMKLRVAFVKDVEGHLIEVVQPL